MVVRYDADETPSEGIAVSSAVAIVGMCAWDRFLVTDHYPEPGDYAIVKHQFEQGGGTTANTSAALARLGIPPMFCSCVGNDDEGQRLIASLRECGCPVDWITVKDKPTDRSWIVISTGEQGVDRTIYWIQGARPAKGDVLPVSDLLDHQWLLIDVDDPRLRSFLLELPAHLSPRTRLLGTMTFLVEMEPEAGLDHALHHDIMFGNERELLTLTQSEHFDDAVEKIQAALPGHACRVMYISRGASGAVAIRPKSVIRAAVPAVTAVDTTGAGDAFAAGCIWAIIENVDDAEVLKRGTTIGSLACRAYGARAALPDRAEALQTLGTATF